MKLSLVFIVGAIVLIFLSIMGLISNYLSPQDKLREADIIVAISGGDTKARAQEAIDLYQDGWAPEILFSGAAFDPLSPSNAEAMQREAQERGISKEVIILEENARDTEENATETKSILDSKKYDTIILVTSPYHQRRAYIEFKSVLGNDVTILNHSAPDDEWGKGNWWQSPRGWWLTVSEAVKIPFSLLKGVMNE